MLKNYKLIVTRRINGRLVNQQQRRVGKGHAIAGWSVRQQIASIYILMYCDTQKQSFRKFSQFPERVIVNYNLKNPSVQSKRQVTLGPKVLMNKFKSRVAFFDLISANTKDMMQFKFRQFQNDVIMLKFQKRASKSNAYILGGILNQADLFGSLPTFRILKNVKYSSKLGLLLTFSLLFTIIVYFTFELIALLQYENPSVVSSQKQILESSAYPLMMKNFTLAITVTDQSFNPLKQINRHFTIKMQTCKRTREKDLTTNITKVSQNCTDYPLENCSMDHFTTPVQIEQFSKVRFGTVQCLRKDLWESSPPTLQGTISGDLFQYVTIKFQECMNTTASKNCAPREESRKLLQSGYYAIYLTDNLVKMDQPGYPFEEVINQQSTTFSITSSKQIYQSLIIQQSKTDVGIIGNNFQDHAGVTWYQNRESQELYNDDYIISHVIRLDTRVQSFQRSYIKLQTVLSKIGGLWQLIFLICSAVIRPFISTKMNLSMMNKLFTFESREEDIRSQEPHNDPERPAQSAVLSPNQSVEGQKNSKFSTMQLSRSADVKNQEQLKNYFKKKKKTLQLTFRNIVSIIFGCNTKFKRQLDYGKEKFMQKLDVAYIISKIYEIDKLKFILLNEEQQQLFNYMPKPTIPQSIFDDKDINGKIEELEQRSSYKYILQEEKSDFIKFEQAFQAYCTISRLENPTNVDMQILSFLDAEIIDLFESLLANRKMAESLFQNSPLKRLKHTILRSPRTEDVLLSSRQEGDGQQ